MGTLALAAQEKIKKATAVKKSAPAAKKTEPKKTDRVSTRGASEAEKAKVAKMYEAGSAVSEISEAMGWVKKGNWPHYYTLGVIRQLRKAGTVGYHNQPESKSNAKKGKRS